MRREFRALLTVTLLGASGCEFFGGDDLGDGDSGTDGPDTDDPDTGEEPPPSQGLRVFPKFMLQAVPAIVTIASDGVSSSACELDPPDGGYVCDAGGMQSGSLATIEIERDGFEMAVRHPEVPFNQIIALDVHLAVAGGPTGEWSPCAIAGDFASCEDLCATFVGSCQVTSCATDQPEWPLATYETFTDAECGAPVESVALACDGELPAAGVVGSLRCCCAF